MNLKLGAIFVWRGHTIKHKRRAGGKHPRRGARARASSALSLMPSDHREWNLLSYTLPSRCFTHAASRIPYGHSSRNGEHGEARRAPWRAP